MGQQQARADAQLRQRRHARAEVAAPAGVTLTLLRSNQTIATERLPEGLASFCFTDEEPLCLEDRAGGGPPFVFYLPKLALPSGQIAWSSPVWLTLWGGLCSTPALRRGRRDR